eukprot:1184149-Amphidinium_carterae.3
MAVMRRALRIQDESDALIAVSPMAFYETFKEYQNYLCSVALPGRQPHEAEAPDHRPSQVASLLL